MGWLDVNVDRNSLETPRPVGMRDDDARALIQKQLISQLQAVFLHFCISSDVDFKSLLS